MRSNRRTPARRRGGDGSFWLSFSDLMSCLVLIIILVMFYMIYQYFNLAEINQAELARRQYQLDQAQTELDQQKTKLTEAEQQMIAQQILLNAKQSELDSIQSVLEAQKTQLSQKEDEIKDQQTRLDDMSAQLEHQQVQIEQLVGMRTRIISSLSDALRNNSISAKVDPVNGSIALESDVLFETGEYGLTDTGKEFIDRFLPIYLNVLFSEEYKGYVTEVIIEGHTDSLGGYIQNLKLSQQRALAVASYVLDDDYSAISASVKRDLREVVTVNGRSYSDLILDANGREDMNASRRVVFKFRLTDEQMIQQLQHILEDPQPQIRPTPTPEPVQQPAAAVIEPVPEAIAASVPAATAVPAGTQSVIWPAMQVQTPQASQAP